MTRRTNFDQYLEDKLQDSEFAEGFAKAGDAWDVAIQLADLRREQGLTQKELAHKARTTQQQISRMESPSYRGHSMREIERVASALGATVRVHIQKRATPLKSGRKSSKTTVTRG